MTSGPDLPERDPALERAWRAQSRETPPVELDRAILAAAHRAVGSGPRQASKSPEAKQPQRWWMPLAAAATIGAVAVGLLQLAPQDAGLVAPTERIAAVAPHRDAATADRNSSALPAQPPAAPPPAAAAMGVTPAATAPNSASAPAVSQGPASAAGVAPPVAASAGRAKEMADQGESAAADALARKADKEPAPDARGLAAKPQPGTDAGAAPSSSPSAASLPATPAAPSSAAVPFPAAAPAPAPSASPVPAPTPSLARAPAPASPPRPAAAESTPAGTRDAPGAVGKLEQRAPEPFPAASRKIEAADAKKDAAHAAPDSAAGIAPAPRVAAPPPPVASVEQDARSAQRKDAGAERQAASAPPVPAEAASTGAAAPGGAGAPMRMRENSAVRDEVRAQAAPQQLAKQAPATVAEAKQKARDPDAWIARIRKLRDEGNTAEAMRELREFREYVPDAERRIPQDLRDLANAVRP